MIDKAVHDQTNEFFSDNKIVYNCQSESRTNHLTNLCLYSSTDKILKCFYEGLLTGMILFDLQKVFDTINLKMLSKNLEAMCFLDQHL